MSDNIFLSHSSRKCSPEQSYVEHINNVRLYAVQFARDAVAYYKGDHDSFIDWVDAAALYHDIGKVDEINQSVLRSGLQKRLPIDHDDAGVALLWKLGRKESAVLVAAHHAGLFSKERENNKNRLFRNEKHLDLACGCGVDKHVDANLEDYLASHKRAGLSRVYEANNGQLHRCGFTRRLALSCLVDADHGDTARHYGNEVETQLVQTRWEERLAALIDYVDKLPKGNIDRERHRNNLRKRLFESCLNAPTEPPIQTCDAPVGSGKTTAVMAHLLQTAIARKPELRHIIVVLPYTNIINQSVEIYRKALLLKGERPQDVVAEHHHRADFDDLDLRQIATHWRAPIIVTTAVQFFETLGSSRPGRLRKLHELPGSAVFVDEMHAAIPSHLWPQMWRWLRTWCHDWGGHLIFASGTLSRFWELEEYKGIICSGDQTVIPEVPDLVVDDSLRDDFKAAEGRRISYHRRPEEESALDCNGVIEFISKKAGPRLLIVNTVHTAAVLAEAMRKSGCDALHLSTALAPIHRAIMVERIRQKLRCKLKDWTLVATSCIEAGMDFSFRIGFRERASTASLIQTGGRVSRGDEFADGEVWDILLRDDKFQRNPALKVSFNVLDGFTEEELNQMHPTLLATVAMKREIISDTENRAQILIKSEMDMEYPSVSQLCRVIDTDTRTVIIDNALAESIQNGDRVRKEEIINYSVQMWARKINKLSLRSITLGGYASELALFTWPYDYDPDYLGYMAGVLKLNEFIAAGGAII